MNHWGETKLDEVKRIFLNNHPMNVALYVMIITGCLTVLYLFM